MAGDGCGSLMNVSRISRRVFLKSSGAVGGGLMLGFPWLRADFAGDGAKTAAFAPSAFIRIAEREGVTLLIPTPEIGQGICTVLAAGIAEEMDLDLDMVLIRQGTMDEAFGHQTAGDSNSVRRQFNNVRRAGAAARLMLLGAAARHWEVSTDTCRTADGRVIHSGNGEWLSFEQLAEAAAFEPVPVAVALKSPAAYRYIGRSILNVDLPEIVTGRIKFGLDATADNLHHAHPRADSGLPHLGKRSRLPKAQLSRVTSTMIP